MTRTMMSKPLDAPLVASAPLVVGRALGTVVVVLQGEIDGSSSTYLAAVLHDLIDGQGNQAVVVDLANLRRVDRLATEVLAAAAHSIGRRGGRLALRRPSADVTEALAAAGLARLVVDGGQPGGTPLPGSLESRPHHREALRLHPSSTDRPPILIHGENP